MRPALTILLATLLPLIAQAQGTRYVRAKLERLKGGSDTVMDVRIKVWIETGWHIGAPKPGRFGLPSHLDWQLPNGWRVIDERWPRPMLQVAGRDTSCVYKDSVIVSAVVAKARGVTGSIAALLTYGVCRDVCIPGRILIR